MTGFLIGVAVGFLLSQLLHAYQMWREMGDMMATRRGQEQAAREADRRSVPPVKGTGMTKTISIRCDLPKMEGPWHFGPVSYDYGSGKLLVPLIEEASPAVSVPLPQEIKANVDELRQEMTGALALLAREMRELREALAADNMPTAAVGAEAEQ